MGAPQCGSLEEGRSQMMPRTGGGSSPAADERWCMPCVGGGDASHGYGGLVGAHQRGSLEVEEKLINGTEGVEARRRPSASGAQPLCRWRRELRPCEASRRGLGEIRSVCWAGPYPRGGYVSGHVLNIPKIK